LVRIGSLARARLPASDFACPSTRSYIISNKDHVSSAKAYYRRPNTAKCEGGKSKICARARGFGMLAASAPQGEDWRKWCK
jgi:hypothetical protein